MAGRRISAAVVACLAACTQVRHAFAQCVDKYQQCGGREYNGPTYCCDGKCLEVNEWWWECHPWNEIGAWRPSNDENENQANDDDNRPSTPEPTRRHTPSPTHRRTPRPTPRPTPHPTQEPTHRPTPHPTVRPTVQPTQRPTPGVNTEKPSTAAPPAPAPAPTEQSPPAPEAPAPVPLPVVPASSPATTGSEPDPAEEVGATGEIPPPEIPPKRPTTDLPPVPIIPPTPAPLGPTPAPTPLTTAQPTPVVPWSERVFPVTQPWKGKGCYKVRRNILALSPQEKADFLEALAVLKANGVYDQITMLHGAPKSFNTFHFTDQFLPWHRWYVMLMENHIRALGGKWRCFAMPYWNWVLDSGNEWYSPLWDFLGPMGNPQNSYCIESGPFHNWTTEKGACIKRLGSNTIRLFTPGEVADLILSNPHYDDGGGKGFRPQFELGAHAKPHQWVGGTQNTFPSPNDPWFWLHHSFVDKIWLMWQDCHHFVNKDKVYNHEFPPNEIDLPMMYANITPRSLWTPWEMSGGYTYEMDLFSTFSFQRQCNFTFFKPNPALVGLSPPSFPQGPSQTRDSSTISTQAPTPPPTAPSISKDAAGSNETYSAVAAPADAALALEKKTALSQRGSLRGSSSSTPSSSSSSPSSSSSSDIMLPRSKSPLLAAEAPDKIPISPEGIDRLKDSVHLIRTWGFPLLEREAQVFESCMAAGADAAACRKEVMRKECDELGPICDPPDVMAMTPAMREAMDVFKSQQVCACKSDDKDAPAALEPVTGAGW